MNRERYIAIRSQLNLEPNPFFLWSYLAQTAVLAGACAFLMWKFSDSAWKYAAIPLIAMIMFRSFALMHEAVHGIAAKNRWLNNAIGVFSGGLCLLSYESWKQAHLEHHRWSGNVDKDPVMAMIRIFPSWPKPLQAVLTFGWKCWVPTLSFLQHTVFWSITVRYTLKKPQSVNHILSVAVPILTWAGLFWILPKNTALSVIAPAVVFYLIGTEVINAPHHLGLPLHHGETQIPVWDQFQIARTCVYPAWLSRFVVLNFNYHAEHHMYPYVPWYHLDKLYAPVRAELGTSYNQDPQFAWIKKNRKKALVNVFVPTSENANATERKNAA
jgi:omega-6 fatty acid desaturase (delta-12 desaturase)